ncbi:hypothetical protein [Gracilibacillus alcaliphilus]|uniref:hypothetical protein n=1 Tax=Gracilibacillus alcaliphilus TaxID=1401441 RepID=UPI00195C6391|nr:hypothetical protein [Gracilibacillus alcaliphilus]MBM7678660.1 gas vesicle protein [Gracilibacillus alcaliphilus]
MDKKYLIGGIVGVATAGLAACLLSSRTNREKLCQMWNNLTDPYSNFPIDIAGDPGLDNLENSDMVEEGSQFSVDYYNKIKQ